MNGQNLNLNKNNIQKIREKENNFIQINTNKNINHKNANEIKEVLLMENNNIEILNLNVLSEEYDKLILNLREQLSKVKEERKKTENEYNIIKHRLTILKNSEKTNNINFQNIKYRFKKIMNNRLESQKKIRKKSSNNSNINRTAYLINKNIGSKYTYPLKMIKKNKSGYNLSHTPKNSLNLSKTYSNFQKRKNCNNNINSFDLDYNLEENKKYKLKQKLIEKLREDEEEKKKIEDEIAKIEKEEFMLLNSFKNDKIYAGNNT